METAIAVLNMFLSLPQPIVPTIQTVLTAKIPQTLVGIYKLHNNGTSATIQSKVALSESICDPQLRADYEGPLWIFDKSPWNTQG